MINDDQYVQIQEAVLYNCTPEMREVLAGGTTKESAPTVGRTDTLIRMMIPPLDGTIQIEGLMDNLRELGTAKGPNYYINQDKGYLEIVGKIGDEHYILQIFISGNRGRSPGPAKDALQTP